MMDYFEVFRDTLREHPGFFECLVFNTDETPLLVHEKKKTGIKEYKGKDQKQKLQFGNPILPEKMTVIVTTSYDGGYCKTGLIFPTEQATHFAEPFLQDHFVYYHQPSTYVTTDIFFKYMEQVLIPKIKETRERIKEPEAKALLIIDNHSSRFQPDVIKLFKDNNVVFHCIPPHTSHIIQPNDMIVNGRLRTELTKNFWTKLEDKQQLTREEMMDVLLESKLKAMTPWAIREGFRRSLLFEEIPIQEEELKLNKFVYTPGSAPEPKPKKRNPAVPIPPSRNLTDDLYYNALVQKKQQKAVKRPRGPYKKKKDKENEKEAKRNKK